MKKQRENIDELFKSGLGYYTEAPPPAVWDALEKRLDAVPSARFRFTNMNPWHYIVPSLLLILSVLTAVRLYHNNTLQNIMGNQQTNAVASNDNGKTENGTGSNSGNNNSGVQTAKSADNNTGGTTANEANHNTATENNTSTAHNHSEDAQQTDDAITTNEKRKSGTHKNHISGKPGALAAFAATVHSKPTPLQGNIPGLQAPSPATSGNTSASPLNRSDAAVVNESLPAANPAAQPKPNTLGKADSVATDKLHEPAAKDKKAADKKAKPVFAGKRFEAGVKGGYEFSFDKGSAQKKVAAAFLQYNFSNKFALMLQPAVKFAELPATNLNGALYYYSVIPGTNSVTFAGLSYKYVKQPDGNATDTFAIRSYNYSQGYNNIVKRYALVQSYTEFELPVLLKFKVSKKLSGYGGVNMQYNRNVSIVEKTTSTPMTNTGTSATQAQLRDPIPATPDINSVISYEIKPLSTYTPLYTLQNSSYSIRLGYMLGVSYEFKPRWLLDALYEQTNVSKNNVGGYNVNSALSSAYLRFTIGYTLK